MPTARPTSWERTSGIIGITLMAPLRFSSTPQVHLSTITLFVNLKPGVATILAETVAVGSGCSSSHAAIQLLQITTNLYKVLALTTPWDLPLSSIKLKSTLVGLYLSR